MGGFDELSDRAWLVPCAILTALLGLAAVTMMVVLGYTRPPDPLLSLRSWLLWTIFATGGAGIFMTLRLMFRGEEHPITVLRDDLSRNRRRYSACLVGMALAGLVIYFFMIVKPQLDVVFPFWADSALADLDHLIFGVDP